MSQLAFSRSRLPSVVNYSSDVIFNNLTGAAFNFDIELGSTLSRFRILTTAGANLFTVNNSGDYIYSQVSQKFIADTADGSDNKLLYFCGGGSNSVTRGAMVAISGNETSASNGILYLYAGNASSAYVDIAASSAVSPTIRFTLTSTEHLRLEPGFLFSNMVAGQESTGAGSAALGANCPAVTASAPYKWLKMKTQDGSTAYFPVWK